ncbi:MAG: aldo/keto reductase [Flavobacteriaceae bacterium]
MPKSLNSKLVAGTMFWGQWGKELSTQEMSDLISFFFENGVSTFDHADIYGGYTMEAAFGQAFSRSSLQRGQVQLISKCGIQYISENRPNEVIHYDTSKAYIIASAEASLKHLKTDYLDALLIHRPSPLMHPEDVMSAAEDLKKSGKILNFGVSNFSSSHMELMMSEGLIDINQIEFSVVQHEALFDGTLDKILQHKIIPMAWGPLRSYFNLEDVAKKQRLKKQISELSTKYNSSEDQLLLAWILNHPSKIHPIIGTTKKDRIQSAIRALSIKLSTEDWFKILVASQGHNVP